MTYSVGDLVILKSGSMRMVVETVGTDGTVSTVWCNDGTIGRDSFAPQLLAKAEDRSERGHGPAHGGHGRFGQRDDRDGRDGRGPRGGNTGYRDRDDPRGGPRDDRPPRKQGWDGKPRDKKYFRKDD